jgi:prophage regulatory protein
MAEQLRNALIKRQQLLELTNLSNTALFDKLNPKSRYHDPSFPKRVYLSSRTVRWRLGDVLDWIEACPRDPMINSKGLQ